MAEKRPTAFITARKGFCYLTVKSGRRNFHIMRIRNYTLDAQDKRDARRRYPDVAFDWKKIARKLAEKRAACRRYRSRRRIDAEARRSWDRQPLHGYAVYDPITRTVYADDVAAGSAALLDAVLSFDRVTGLPLLPPISGPLKPPKRTS